MLIAILGESDVCSAKVEEMYDDDVFASTGTVKVNIR